MLHTTLRVLRKAKSRDYGGFDYKRLARVLEHGMKGDLVLASPPPRFKYEDYEWYVKGSYWGDKDFEGYLKSIKLDDDMPVALSYILERYRLNNAMMCLRYVLPEEQEVRDRFARLLACDCAEHVAHLWQAPPGVTWKPADAIDVARRYALGQATRVEMTIARATAIGVYDALSAAQDALVKVNIAAAWQAGRTSCDVARAARWAADAIEDTPNAVLSAAGAASIVTTSENYFKWGEWATTEQLWQSQRFSEMLQEAL